MSQVFKRGLSTLIPPKIASSANLGSNPNAKKMVNVISFYKALPRGEVAPAKRGVGLFKWYKAKYFDTDSSAPLLHLIAFGLLFGYANDYHFHLSHEHGH
ncbi:hypothetical protein DV451_002476 [Geotrichum candidum]|uniref:Similar to Saccharomyces cerevisiae YDR377W ATP17 Subunit f of the F0 sector of mitochondrial F1F0 ATP synthase n=1 Tax=Geotrichum candidum TaxID=1173061 RepID=A0A0J9X9B2_GEOCN|nr:hypothetical protein DV451_002476 [Geotrichum candidum]KAF5107094.1 hypothetical protein DV453_003378 [Geotrichum candidum]KAF5113392.1 hypothetical protein DV454_003623 [Geotrichum candidum]KAF5115488.1 hypothetical protein DV452_002970 [Geotrichum candidum]KAF5132446.1 hypothetical protein DV495_001251 [Geotrichum candidum]